jgi:CheY-like chemotaxis protein
LHLSLLVEDAGATSLEEVGTEADAVSAAQAHRPDVILSDVRLLEGTGPAAVARIRDELGAIPVIFVTGTPDECDACHYAAAVLTKPVDDRALTALFQQLAP